MSIYEENGFDTREDYMASLAVKFTISKELVEAIADALGKSEDFKGLVESLSELIEIETEEENEFIHRLSELREDGYKIELVDEDKKLVKRSGQTVQLLTFEELQIKVYAKVIFVVIDKSKVHEDIRL